MDERVWCQNADVSLVIRTDFADPRAWTEIQAAIAEPRTEEGFTALVAFVDDRAFEGVTPSQLSEKVPADTRHPVAFLVDREALTHPERPILAVYLGDRRGPLYGATFRVVPSEMWSVQNNLTLANMDWAEFAGAVGEDGVFRGFA